MAGPTSNVGTARPPSGDNYPESKSIGWANLSSGGKSGEGPNPGYQVILNVTEGVGPGSGSLKSASGSPIFPMVGYMNKEYGLSFSSNWETPFEDKGTASGMAAGLLGMYAKSKGIDLTPVKNKIQGGIGVGLNAMGVSNRSKITSAQVWTSSTPLQFSFNFNFVAINDSDRDIRDKHMALLKLAAPSEGLMGSMFSPGPTITGAAGGVVSPSLAGRQISLRVGRYLFLDNVIIKSVDSTITGLSDVLGNPLSANVNLSVATFFACFTTNDIDKMFKEGREGGIEGV